MNQLTNVEALLASDLTMTSREIAEMTGKRHDHVLRDIRAMMKALGRGGAGTTPQIWGVVRVDTGQGAIREFEVANLPKDLTLTLVSGYSTVLRHRIVTRWLHLEGQEQQRKLQALFAERDSLKLTHEALIASDSLMTMTEAAKHLSLQPHTFIKTLVDSGWVYKRSPTGHYYGGAEALKKGFVAHKARTYHTKEGVLKTSSERLFVTHKGLMQHT